MSSRRICVAYRGMSLFGRLAIDDERDKCPGEHGPCHRPYPLDCQPIRPRMRAATVPVPIARALVVKAHCLRALPGVRNSAIAVLTTSAATTMTTVRTEASSFTLSR